MELQGPNLLGKLGWRLPVSLGCPGERSVWVWTKFVFLLRTLAESAWGLTWTCGLSAGCGWWVQTELMPRVALASAV